MASSIRFSSELVCLVVSWLLTTALPAAPFAGGTGEPNDPYRIATAEQLTSIGSDPNLLDKHFVLLNDVDLDPNLPGGQVFVRAVIAPDVNLAADFQGTPFTGGFDGNGHAVKNLVIHNDADFLDIEGYLALFGKLGERAVVRNLTVKAADIGERYGGPSGVLAAWNEGYIAGCHVEGFVFGCGYIGGLVGRNLGEIRECQVSCDWVAGCAVVGGLAGANDAGARILQCHATCSIFLQQEIGGGLVGSNEGYIANSDARGDVTATGYGTYAVGGLVGDSRFSGLIEGCWASVNILTWGPRGDFPLGQAGGLVGRVLLSSVVNCYATGNVSGCNNNSSLGGLVGQMFGRYVVNSYATGRVSAGSNSTDLGGLVGSDPHNVGGICNCFWDVETSGLPVSDGGTGLTTAQMNRQASFVGWDFETVWTICEGQGYPRLRWEQVSCGPAQ